MSSKCRGTKPSDTRDEARSIHQVSRSYQRDKNFLDRSTRCPGGIEIVIRKSLETRQIARCRGGIELAFKINFFRRKKHRHECNQACNSTNDPNTILTSQNHLSTENFKHMDLKNIPAHTKQVQPIFYFKNKSRQFSEYILTHVNLVMAKSHCTCTCIKSSKEYCVLCMKNITRLHKYIHVMTI